ncbi:fumarylacetoacetase, partial [Streptomyces sp. SID8380]|nr:fumarylacetoacetase [Streptomyces sp. SID8380]
MTAATWAEVPMGSPFPLQNLPYGVFTPAGDTRARVGGAIGA